MLTPYLFKIWRSVFIVFRMACKRCFIICSTFLGSGFFLANRERVKCVIRKTHIQGMSNDMILFSKETS